MERLMMQIEHDEMSLIEIGRDHQRGKEGEQSLNPAGLRVVDCIRQGVASCTPPMSPLVPLLLVLLPCQRLLVVSGYGNPHYIKGHRRVFTIISRIQIRSTIRLQVRV